MIKLLYVFSLGLLTSVFQPSELYSQESITTYYCIRHAEKDRSDMSNRNPSLTQTGLERAQKWSEILKDIDFDLVYSTNYKRTIATALPTADKQQLEIEFYDPRDLYNDKFQEVTNGKVVLVVGHSNTTPQFVNAAIGNEMYQDIDDTDNGSLFIVTLKDGMAPSVQLLHFD